MRLWLIPAALAVLAVPVSGSALASEANGLERYTGSMFDTSFDLGFDVSAVPHTAAAAKSAIGVLDIARQRKVVLACGYFLQYPYVARSPETRAFCANLYQ